MNGAVRDDNAIGSGSIPKMTGLAGLDPSGSVEQASRIVTPMGTSTKSWKEAPSCGSCFFVPCSLVLLCGLIALGTTTAEAALAIGVH